jgi:hypothetical protein
MADPLSTTISLLALAVSSATAWLTLVRRGEVKMTQPTVIFFGPDGGRPPNRGSRPKVFLRTLLFSTSKRGRVIESMHVRLTRSETRQNFNIWVYGEGKLVRGSGLFVGETGVATNHHFLLPEDAAHFRFVAGAYHLEVFARVLGDRHHRLLFAQTLLVSEQTALALDNDNNGLYFDWGPDSSQYHSHIEQHLDRLRDALPDFLSSLLPESREESGLNGDQVETH